MRILVADDQTAILEAAKLLLKSDGHTAKTAESPQAVLRLAGSEAFDLILMDLNYARDTTSGREGLDLLAGLRSAGVDTPVVVMTAWGTVDIAVEAMRRGACDFIQKPWDNARLLETIHKQVDKARASKSDLDIARNVQAKLLPTSGPPVAGLDYSARCMPARGIGGDYYDWFPLGSGQIGFVLADVSGKGMGAALLMAHLHAAFHTRLSMGFADTPSLLSGLNRQFWESSPPEQYATLFFARYDSAKCRMTYVNAGHQAGLVVRSTGEVEHLESTALPVGAFPVWSAEEQSVPLSTGDVVVLFSDGVVEAGMQTGVEFGEERLLDTIRGAVNAPAAELVDAVCGRVARYSDDPFDDCTVVALRCR
jgi:sigma-B regulation protein RsbU (phosphoserine phosphatase)